MVTTSGSAEASVARSTPHEIRFEHVSFSYPGSTKPAVKDINIVIKNGEHLAIVGKNGSGKSTFVKLLCRMYEPQKGHIYLDGKEIRSYSKEEYWKILGVVFQDFALIGLPLAENIAASEEYDENKVRHCLKDTGLEEWVDQLKNGLNEWMSASEGTAPSGGEKQRLALARAQYRDPFLMVLDEPTAALDQWQNLRSFKSVERLQEVPVQSIFPIVFLPAVSRIVSLYLMKEVSFRKAVMMNWRNKEVACMPSFGKHRRSIIYEILIACDSIQISLDKNE